MDDIRPQFISYFFAGNCPPRIAGLTAQGGKYLYRSMHTDYHSNLGTHCTAKGMKMAQIRSSQDLRDVHDYLSWSSQSI